MPTLRSWLNIALRLGSPATLIIIGMLTIAGCVYIPVPEHPRTAHGADVREVLGAEGTDKPIRPGVANRDVVLRLLGEPDDRTEHDLGFAYHLTAIAGHRFGFCVADDETERTGRRYFAYPATDRVPYFLLLRFDHQGVLRQYQLKRGDAETWRELLIEVGNEDRVRG